MPNLPLPSWCIRCEYDFYFVFIKLIRFWIKWKYFCYRHMLLKKGNDQGYASFHLKKETVFYLYLWRGGSLKYLWVTQKLAQKSYELTILIARFAIFVYSLERFTRNLNDCPTRVGLATLNSVWTWILQLSLIYRKITPKTHYQHCWFSKPHL